MNHENAFPENNLMQSNPWALPEDLCKKDPFNFNMETFLSKVGDRCPAPGQPLASRILCALAGGYNTKSPGQDFVRRVAQKLANS